MSKFLSLFFIGLSQMIFSQIIAQEVQLDTVFIESNKPKPLLIKAKRRLINYSYNRLFNGDEIIYLFKPKKQNLVGRKIKYFKISFQKYDEGMQKYTNKKFGNPMSKKLDAKIKLILYHIGKKNELELFYESKPVNIKTGTNKIIKFLFSDIDVIIRDEGIAFGIKYIHSNVDILADLELDLKKNKDKNFDIKLITWEKPLYIFDKSMVLPRIITPSDKHYYDSINKNNLKFTEFRTKSHFKYRLLYKDSFRIINYGMLIE